MNRITGFVVIAGIAALSGCDVQKNMLYYPSTYLPSRHQLIAENIQFWPSDSIADYRGFIGAVPAKKIKGTVVVFHGNAGTAADRAYYVSALSPLGYRVILAEYPGYGARTGELRETAFANDAKETLRLVSERYREPVFLLGESLGCAVAAAAANDSPVPIEAIILITPWDTLLSVAKGYFPWLPVRLFLRDTYDSIQNLKAFQGRIAVIEAERDEIIPVRHARKLYEALPENKRIWTIKGAGHNDWLDFVDARWWEAIMEFVQKEDNK